MNLGRESRVGSRGPGRTPAGGYVCSRPSTPGARPGLHAFTLLEVLIAGGILFMCLFAILLLVSNTLRNARVLQHTGMDAGLAAAQLFVQFTTTNQVAEGSGTGDLGDLCPGYRYDWMLTEVVTNGLCRLDIAVRPRSGDRQVDSEMSLLLYLPNLQRRAGP